MKNIKKNNNKIILTKTEELLLEEKEKYAKRRILDIFFDNDVEKIIMKDDKEKKIMDKLDDYVDVLNTISYIKYVVLK